MRNSVAKKLRRSAEELTVGKPPVATRKVYQDLKKKYKRNPKNFQS